MKLNFQASISRTPTSRQSAIPKATTQITQRTPPTATSKLQSGVAKPKEAAKSATPATSTSASKAPQKTPIRGPKKDTNSIEKWAFYTLHSSNIA